VLELVEALRGVGRDAHGLQLMTTQVMAEVRLHGESPVSNGDLLSAGEAAAGLTLSAPG
jgi:hypothetical protein